MKRFLIILLILSFILCSCTGAEQESSTETVSETEAPVYEAQIEYTDLIDLPVRDMEGATVVLTAARSRDFTSGGKYLYDAALSARNVAIRKKFKAAIAVTERDAAAIFSELTAAKAQGLYYSDLLALPMSEVGRFARNGLIKDLSTLEGIDPSAEYFVKTDAFTDLGATYAYMCESVTSGYGYGVYFNERLAEEKGLDLYSMVSEGTWTWDVFTEMVSDMPYAGFTYGDADEFVNAVVTSCGLRYTTLEDGVRSADYVGEGTDGILEKASTVYNSAGSAASDDPVSLFSGGGCLFYVGPLYNAEHFATMPDSYGILPLPTYEGGTDYKTYMPKDTPVLCIPAGECATENAPYMLTALAAASEADLQEKYVLHAATFYLTSDSAAKCVKLIEESSVYEYVYAFGPYYNEIANCTYWSVQEHVKKGVNHRANYGAYLPDFNNFVN